MRSFNGNDVFFSMSNGAVMSQGDGSEGVNAEGSDRTASTSSKDGRVRRKRPSQVFDEGSSESEAAGAPAPFFARRKIGAPLARPDADPGGPPDAYIQEDPDEDALNALRAHACSEHALWPVLTPCDAGGQSTQDFTKAVMGLSNLSADRFAIAGVPDAAPPEDIAHEMYEKCLPLWLRGARRGLAPSYAAALDSSWTTLRDITRPEFADTFWALTVPQARPPRRAAAVTVGAMPNHINAVLDVRPYGGIRVDDARPPAAQPKQQPALTFNIYPPPNVLPPAPVPVLRPKPSPSSASAPAAPAVVESVSDALARALDTDDRLAGAARDADPDVAPAPVPSVNVASLLRAGGFGWQAVRNRVVDVGGRGITLAAVCAAVGTHFADLMSRSATSCGAPSDLATAAGEAFFAPLCDELIERVAAPAAQAAVSGTGRAKRWNVDAPTAWIFYGGSVPRDAVVSAWQTTVGRVPRALPGIDDAMASLICACIARAARAYREELARVLHGIRPPGVFSMPSPRDALAKLASIEMRLAELRTPRVIGLMETARKLDGALLARAQLISTYVYAYGDFDKLKS